MMRKLSMQKAYEIIVSVTGIGPGGLVILPKHLPPRIKIKYLQKAVALINTSRSEDDEIPYPWVVRKSQVKFLYPDGLHKHQVEHADILFYKALNACCTNKSVTLNDDTIKDLIENIQANPRINEGIRFITSMISPDGENGVIIDLARGYHAVGKLSRSQLIKIMNRCQERTKIVISFLEIFLQILADDEIFAEGADAVEIRARINLQDDEATLSDNVESGEILFMDPDFNDLSVGTQDSEANNCPDDYLDRKRDVPQA